MGGGKGGGGSSKTTSTPYLKDEVKDAAGRALTLLQKGQPAYYPDQTYVDYSPETLQALDSITQRAQSGSPLTGAANQTVLDTINGNYLNSNPYIDRVVNSSLDDVYKKYSDQILPGLASGFAQSGRYGSGIQQQMTADTVGQLGQEAMGVASGIRYYNYNQERARQLNAASIAPTLAQQDYYDAQQLLGVGAARETLEQAKLQDDMDRYWYNANAKNNALDQYISRISQLNGGFGTQTQSSSGGGGSVLGSALGLGLTGLGLASGFGAFGTGAGLLSSGTSIPSVSSALAGTGLTYMLPGR